MAKVFEPQHHDHLFSPTVNTEPQADLTLKLI